jgi:hypothetical protein
MERKNGRKKERKKIKIQTGPKGNKVFLHAKYANINMQF